MTFAWPWMLLSLAALPLLLWGYRRLLRRRLDRRAALAALGLVALPALSSGRRRHLAPALFGVALALLLTAMARPQATVADARREGTVVLAFDVSNSMAATDSVAHPDGGGGEGGRPGLARRQPATIKVGVAVFGESGLDHPGADH